MGLPTEGGTVWSTQPVGLERGVCQGLEKGHRTEGEARKEGLSWVEAQAEIGLDLDPVSMVLIISLPWPCLFSPRLPRHPDPGPPSPPSLSFLLKSIQVLLHDLIRPYPLTLSTRSQMNS